MIKKTRPDLKPYQGKELNVIAWIWARTVKVQSQPFPSKSPSDIYLHAVNKKGKETYVSPFIEENTYKFSVNIGNQQTEPAAKKVAQSFSGQISMPDVWRRQSIF